MANNGLTKSYTAEGNIPANRIVKVGANDFGVLVAAAVSDKSIGISTEVDAVSGERVDVVLSQIADLKLGGTVARGDLLTSDATGQGVTAAPVAGTNNRVVGVALISGVSGDIIPVMIAQGTFQG
jgi:Uncharacterized conserved protein (DUF2190)